MFTSPLTHRVTVCLAIVVVLSPIAFSALADMSVNEGGYLMVHSDPSIVYDPSYPDPSYYMEQFPAGCPSISPDSCGYYRLVNDCHYGDELIPTLQSNNPPVFGQTGVFWVCAVFPDTTCVDLHIVEFGMLLLEGQMELFDWGHDARYAYPHVRWPGKLTGIRLEFDPPRTSHVVPLVWMAARTHAGNGRAWLGPYPEHDEVHFYPNGSDDPAEALQPYPVWGFNLTGMNPTINLGPLERVCCVGFNCSIVGEADCQSLGGLWFGFDMQCDPNPCDIYVPTRETSWGQIRALYRTVTE